MPVCMNRAGHNHIYTVCIRYFWQGNHQIYGHIRCIYTVLANPMYEVMKDETTGLNRCMYTYMRYIWQGDL